MMFKLISLVVILQVVHSSAVPSQTQDDTPASTPFCNQLNCPGFSILEDVQGKYQKRRYAVSNWVTTQMAGIDYNQAKSMMFRKLFQYISGNNVRGEKIAMTAPVIAKLIPGQGPACENNFTMSFYVSSSVTNPPQPRDATVALTQLPELVAYVRVFSGFARSTDIWVDEASKLVTDLNGITYNTNFFYTAGYDSPYRLTNRHNEVWLLA